jgi:hypothetical protein
MKKPRAYVNAFMDSAIRQKIREFYVVKIECPSIRKLLKDLWKYFIDCGLHKIGFKWEKCATNSKILIERPDVAVWRTRYLRKIRKRRREGKLYVQQSHSVQSCWQSEEEF